MRYVSPQADPATRTYTVRVALPDAPPQMRLGATVTGSVTSSEAEVVSLPSTALFDQGGKPAVWLVGSDGTVALKPITVARYGDDSFIVGSGLAQGGDRRHRRRAEAGPGRKGPPDDGERRAMTGFNLSEWAINHRPFVWFLMIAFVAGGVLSYGQLGREEDPSFTIKTMLVQTQWPGATIDDTLLQVTDRLEKKLQETPYIDYLKSYTKPGVSTIYVELLDNDAEKRSPGYLVAGP